MSDLEEDDLEFRINTKFAQNYDKWRRKEELQKLKDRYGEDVGDDSSSSSEEEDEDAEGLTAQIEKDFLKTLSCLKSRDPKIYNQEATFYHDQGSSSDSGLAENGPAAKAKKARGKARKEDKPVYLKDYERQIITERGGRYSDESENDGEMDADSFERAASPTYVQEQELIRQSFKKALLSSDSEVSDEEGPLLSKRKKTPKEQKEEEEEYIQWMKGQKETVSDEAAAQDVAEMTALRKYWTDPSLEEGERFLRDFILNKGYKEKDVAEEDPGMVLEEADFSEDERLLDKQDEFERKYNFRYEEPDDDFIKRYPRTMANSVRTKDNKRALKRQDRKERKLEEKERKKDDLKQMKNLKKQEILDKLKKLQQVTGNACAGFDDEDLQGDFDPEQHDKAMKKVFDDQYDTLAEEDTKPVFEHEVWEEENWDNWDGQDHGDAEYYEDEVYCEDPDFNMDADYDPSLSKQANRDKKASLQQELIDSSSRKKKRKKMSTFAEALNAKKPVFDPADTTIEEYIDEFYKLDYEDMIGDMPCRFKYRKVVANDFGLTTEEILGAKERELNQWASLKKTCQYRTEEQEEYDKKFFAKKGKNEAKKNRVFLSLLVNPSDSETSEDEGTRKKPTANSKNRSLPLSKKARQRPSRKQKVAGGSGTPNTAAIPRSKDLDEGDSNTTHTSEPKAKSLSLKGTAKKQKLGAAEVNQNQVVVESTELKSNTKAKQESKDKDRGFNKLITSPVETGKETNADHSIKKDASGEKTSLIKVTKKKKRKRRRSHSGDPPREKVIDPQSHAISGIPTPTKSKGTVALKDDPTPATKASVNTKGASSKKRKRKVGKNGTDPDQSKLKTDAGITSESLSASVSNGKDKSPELKVTLQMESQSQGSKKRKRKRKNSSNKTEQGGLAAASPTTKKTDVPRSKPKVKPSPGLHPLQTSKRVAKAATNKNRQSTPSPSSKRDQGGRKRGLNSQNDSAKSQRTRNKNRNRRLAKLGEKKPVEPAVSDARLKAYGINPKKHGYRMRFLKEQEAKRKQTTHQGSQSS